MIGTQRMLHETHVQSVLRDAFFPLLTSMDLEAIRRLLLTLDPARVGVEQRCLLGIVSHELAERIEREGEADEPLLTAEEALVFAGGLITPVREAGAPAIETA